MRGEQVQRQWKLLMKLQTRGEGFPLKDLAESFQVTERTIQRDFETLEELDFPIEYDEDDVGKRYWRLPHDFFKSGPFVLTFTEAVSLHLAERLLNPLAGTHLAEGMQTILDKIRTIVPKKALDYFAGLDQTVYIRQFGTTDYTPHAETIWLLADAARSERSVEVTYRALWTGESYKTLFDPYGLVYYEGDLFVVGKSHRADDLRIFKVVRISSVDLTDRKFERPADFRLEDQFRSSFGIIQSGGQPVEITVKFTGTAANLIEERLWHESQRILWLPQAETLFDRPPSEPDTLAATFRLSDVVEFKRWIKGFGQRAEVLKPAWLRSEIHEELLQAAKAYEG